MFKLSHFKIILAETIWKQSSNRLKKSYNDGNLAIPSLMMCCLLKSMPSHHIMLDHLYWNKYFIILENFRAFINYCMVGIAQQLSSLNYDQNGYAAVMGSSSRLLLSLPVPYVFLSTKNIVILYGLPESKERYTYTRYTLYHSSLTPCETHHCSWVSKWLTSLPC